MKTVVVFRDKHIGPEILGHLLVFDDTPNGGRKKIFECKTLELAWKGNKKNISCVPNGKYPLEFEYSPKFKRKLWELKDVPNRSEAKIHVANFYTQLRGCIAIGDMHTNLNDDKIPDVRNSSETVKRFHKAMDGVTTSIIEIFGSEGEIYLNSEDQ